MANTFTQLHVQYVFAVKYRAALIHSDWEERLHQYITGIFRLNNHKMLQINSLPDHLHILTGLNPIQSVSSIIQNVKSESSKWINEKKLTSTNFAWQNGYGAFSYSKSQIPEVATYIQNQKAHHRKETFIDEYKSLLRNFEIPYDERYIFKELI